MSKVNNHQQLTPTLGLTECRDGFWLYDETRGMNLAMRAKTEQAAFVKALGYYQRRLQEVESKYSVLKNRVDQFVERFVNEDEE